jgi:cytochrome P450
MTNDSTMPAGSLADRTVQQCPYSFYRELREHAPVFHDAAVGMWIVSTDALIREVLNDPATYVNRVSLAPERLIGEPAEATALRARARALAPTLNDNDPPGHTRIRRMAMPEFGPSRVREHAPMVERVVRESIDAFIDRGEVEVVSEFAGRIPLLVMAHLLGFAPEGADDYRRYVQAVVGPLGMGVTPEQQVEYARWHVEALDFYHAQIEHRRSHPGKDLVSAALAARDEHGNGFSEPELIDLVKTYLVGGADSVIQAIAAGMKILVERPDLLRRLREDLAAIPQFVEEAMRWESPTGGLLRFTSRATTLGGVAIPKDAYLMLRFAAANRDAARWPNAEEIDLDRRNVNQHLVFGGGIHRCIGSVLAQLELRTTWTAVAARLENLRFSPGRNSFEYNPSILFRRNKDLWVQFDRR